MSAVIVSGNSRYGVVGAYIPPADSTTTAHIASALARFPRRKVILVGDLNLNLDSLETDRDMEIADCLATSGLIDMHRHFKLESKNRMPDTWHQEREGEKSGLDRIISSARIDGLSGDMLSVIPAILLPITSWSVVPLPLTQSRKIRLISRVGLSFPTGPPKWDLP